MAERNRFLVYLEWEKLVDGLSDEKAGILFKALFDYWRGEVPDFDGEALRLVSSYIFDRFKKDDEAYREKCEAYSVNGKLGGRPRKSRKSDGFSEKAIESDGFSGKAKKADTDKIRIEKIYNDIADAYNRLCPSLAKCTKLSDRRKKQIKTRLCEGYKLQDFEEVFQKAEASDFLSGRTQSWRGANFDWLIKNENMLKVLEGQFENPRRGDDTQAGKIDFGQYGI